MDRIEIAKTEYSPQVILDDKRGVLDLQGESYPENVAAFYRPVFEWLNRYLGIANNTQLTVNIELLYFNSSSSKVLMDMLDVLEDASRSGKGIVVNWRYDEDNDMAEEYGQEFAEDVDHLTFHLITV
jgi:hypothetical protein